MATLRSPERTRRIIIPRSATRYLTTAYGSCIMIAPLAAGSSWLMPVIIVARLLLFAPLFLFTAVEPDRQDGSKGNGAWNDVVNSWTIHTPVAAFASLSTLWQAYVPIQDGPSLGGIVGDLFIHPAVSALCCDLIICVLSFTLWTLRHRYALHTPLARNKEQ